jgi:hypothetical protein
MFKSAHITDLKWIQIRSIFPFISRTNSPQQGAFIDLILVLSCSVILTLAQRQILRAENCCIVDHHFQTISSAEAIQHQDGLSRAFADAD